MAHFYADIQGSRGEGTRCGDKRNGIRGHIRGWHIGGIVRMRYNEKTDKDECTITLTGGSGGEHNSICLGTFTEDDLKQSSSISIPLVRPLVKLREAEGVR